MTLGELLKVYNNENDHLIVRNRSNSKTITDLESICLLGEMSALLDEPVLEFRVIGSGINDEGIVCHYSMLVNLDIDDYIEPTDDDDNGYDILGCLGLYC